MLSISTKNKAGLLLIQRKLYRKYRFVFFFFHDWNSPPLVVGSLFVVYKWWHRGSDVTTSRPSSQLHNWVWQALIHTTHTPQPFYSPFSGTTRVSRCQKRTLWCKGDRCRYTDHTAGRYSIQTNQCPPPASPFFICWMPFLPPNQQCQSTEGKQRIRIREKTLQSSSTVLPVPSPYLGSRQALIHVRIHLDQYGMNKCMSEYCPLD